MCAHEASRPGATDDSSSEPKADSVHSAGSEGSAGSLDSASPEDPAGSDPEPVESLLADSRVPALTPSGLLGLSVLMSIAGACRLHRAS